MKKIAYATVVLALGMGLAGCGSNTPEEVAKIFASSLSNTDIEEVNSVASEDVQQKLKSLGSICNKPAVTKLADETIVVLNTIEKKSIDKKYSEQLKKVLDQNKQDMKKLTKEIEEDYISRFGSLKNLPKESKDEEMNKAMEKFVEITNPMIEEWFKILDIKTENPDEVKKIIAEFMIKGGKGTRVNYGNLDVLKNIVSEHLSKREAAITPECVAKYTEFGFIDEINIIETKEHSPDSADVRLELISEDGKSKKVSIDVEKIKDEWRVASFSLNAW